MIAEALAPPESVPVETPKKTSAKNLWKRYSTEDYGTDLENDLIHKHLPLVKSVVGRIAMNLPPHVPREDLHSVGMMGLLQAIRNYDPSNTASLESYARHRIRGAVLDELRRIDWVPRSVHDKSKTVQKAIAELEQTFGRIPEGHEVAKHLKLTQGDYEALIEKIKPATFISLDAAPRNDSDSDEPFAIQDDHAPDPVDETSKREMIRIIGNKINDLPDSMRKVLSFYYFESMRLREIAEIFGVTESRICQIHSQAILSLRALVKGL
jgi:RNA polymerase sigma factor for flagellar operon FliA